MGEDKGTSSDSERLVAHEVSPAEQPYGGTEEVEITATLSQAPLPHPEIYGEFERQVPGTAVWLRETAAWMTATRSLSLSALPVKP